MLQLDTSDAAHRRTVIQAAVLEWWPHLKPVLLQWLTDDPDPDNRAEAFQLLADRLVDREPLVASAYDDHATVRLAYATAPLGVYRDSPLRLLALLQLTADQEAVVAAHAQEAVLLIEEDVCAPFAKQANDPAFLGQAADAFRELKAGPPRVIQALRAISLQGVAPDLRSDKAACINRMVTTLEAIMEVLAARRQDTLAAAPAPRSGRPKQRGL